MKKIDRYILLNYMRGFFLGISIFLLIYLLAESVNVTSWILDDKLSLKEGLKYIYLGLPEMIINTAPLGILLGSLLSISNMAQKLEIVAIKTGGISFFRTSLFPLIFSFLVTCFVIFLNVNILGEYNQKRSDMKTIKVNQEEKTKIEKEFVMIKASKNKILFSNHVNKTEKTMTAIELIEMKDDFSGIKEIVTAKSAKLDESTGKWIFESPKKYDTETGSSINIDSSTINFDMKLDDILADPVKEKNLTMGELREKSVYFGRVGADSIYLLIEFYYRISFAFSSFIMSFIGLSLGSKYVRGGAAINIGLSVLIGYSYYGLSTMLKIVAGSKVMPIYLACWLPNILFIAVGIYLFRNAEY